MFEAIISKFRDAERIGIYTHVHADGDAMGSSYALKLALTGQGKTAEVFLLPEPDYVAHELVLKGEDTGLKPEDCDLSVAVDCADIDRLDGYGALFDGKRNTVAIDHHITHREFAAATVVEDCSSACEIMVRLLHAMEAPVTKEIAHNLYIGMISDTGNFQYSSVTPETLRLASELLETGIDAAYLSRKLFQIKTREYYALMQTALNRLQFYEDQKVCALCFTPEDFAAAGLEESKAVTIVTIPISIDGVELGIYLRKRENDVYKVSLRGGESTDVAKIAAAFGGGGHLRASGFTLAAKTPEELVEKILTEWKKQSWTE